MRDGKAGGQSQQSVMLGTATETPATAEGSREARTQQMHAACQVLAPTPIFLLSSPSKTQSHEERSPRSPAAAWISP